MKIDTRPLLDAIERYIAKADDDLADTLAEEGYPKAKEAVKLASSLEDAVDDALDADSLEFLERVQDAAEVEGFIKNVWPDIKDSETLETVLYGIFAEKFDEMLRSFAAGWLLADVPVLSGIDEEVTKPSEAFIKGWSGELARIMNLNTKDSMERLLLKADDKGWTVDELAEAIGDSGIRNHGYRSRRVALTEMLRVQSYAQQESMVQNPLAYKKKWIHVMSEHPRENHMAMDGQTVFKREFFSLTGADGTAYQPLRPRDTGLPASETINCHCIMETIADENALGMADEELKAKRKEYMDEVNAEYDAYVKKFKEDYGIEEPRDDPSITWEMYNAYYEAYKRGEVA
ncbi:MAG: phage head morphogenesis protein [Clostridiales bacterium]|nr:phage head morphogenesis protein [Clostridiales bacterium]